MANYDWAVNKLKLSQSIDKLRKVAADTKAEPKLDDASVKEEYLKRGGLILGESGKVEKAVIPSPLSAWNLSQLIKHAEDKGVDLTGSKNKKSVLDKLAAAGVTEDAVPPALE